jgi:hypothetical protein
MQRRFHWERRKNMNEAQASVLQLWGAGCFGTFIGWYLYYINRHRKSEVQIGDLVTVIGVIGGGAVLALFPAKSDLFGAYGIGLAVGFFGYFFVLIVLVGFSQNFNMDWFLDGRRKRPTGEFYIPGDTASSPNIPMARENIVINP